MGWYLGNFTYDKEDKKEATRHIVSSAEYWLNNDDNDFYQAHGNKQDAFDSAVEHVFFAHTEQQMGVEEVENAKKKLGWKVKINMPKGVVYPKCSKCKKELRSFVMSINDVPYCSKCFEKESP